MTMDTHVKKMSLPVFILIWILAVSVGCENDYPEPSTGEVMGQVTYDGAAIADVVDPVLIVSAYAYQPDVLERLRSGERVISHASHMIVNPLFEDGSVSYVLRNLEPFAKGYLVTATILDLAHPEMGAYASGVYPDMSLMFTPPERGTVDVVAGETVTGISFSMMDIPR